MKTRSLAPMAVGNTVTWIATTVYGFAVVALIVGWVGKPEFGIWATIGAIRSFAVFLDGGLAASVTRDVALGTGRDAGAGRRVLAAWRLYGVLGVIDPTRIANGLYTVRISAYDDWGNFTVFNTVDLLEVTGKLKIGQFSLAFQDITIPVSFASEYSVDQKRSARLLALAQLKKASVYLTGTGSRSYLEEELFRSEGIRVVWQDFRHPSYPQLHGEFETMLSCLDVMFNCGRDSANILRSTIAD